jgi:hypothetical protein
MLILTVHPNFLINMNKIIYDFIFCSFGLFLRQANRSNCSRFYLPTLKIKGNPMQKLWFFWISLEKKSKHLRQPRKSLSKKHGWKNSPKHFIHPSMGLSQRTCKGWWYTIDCYLFFPFSPSIKMGYIREKERHPKNLPQMLA